MRALIQRVTEARVMVDDRIAGQIGKGLLVFLGVKTEDTRQDAEFLARKVLRLRIFPDAQGKMNLSLLETTREMLVVSQFTLYGDTRKGNRPSYSEAARPEIALDLYSHFLEICGREGIRVESGVFQAHMQVHLTNDGPVTLMCYSERHM